MDLATYKKIKKLDYYDNIHSVTFSVIVNKECFYDRSLEENSIVAISGINEDGKWNDIEKKYEIYEYDKCIHTIFKIQVDITNEDIEYIRNYIKESNIEVCGKSMARFITFEHKENKSYDYVEIWIPIK